MAETHHKVRILHSGQVLPFPSSEFAQFALSWHRGVISFGLPLLGRCCLLCILQLCPRQSEAAGDAQHMQEQHCRGHSLATFLHRAAGATELRHEKQARSYRLRGNTGQEVVTIMLYLLCSVLGGHTLLGESNRALEAIRSPFLPTTSEEGH